MNKTGTEELACYLSSLDKATKEFDSHDVVSASPGGGGKFSEIELENGSVGKVSIRDQLSSIT